MRSTRSIARQTHAVRRLVTLFALLAVFLQGFEVQTHIHRLAFAPATTQAANSPAPAPLKSRDPIDQAGCRLCQELAHSGVFVGTAAVSLFSGFIFVTAAFIPPPPVIARAAQPFGWQSRAPPR